MPRVAKKKAATPKQRVQRGGNALKLLENSVIQEALDSLENQYIEDWKNTKNDDTAGRELCYANQRVLQDFKDKLASFVADARMATKQLDKEQSL